MLACQIHAPYMSLGIRNRGISLDRQWMNLLLRWCLQLIMTFTLVSVVYATAVAKPGHGACAPLAIGFTLFASAFVGARLRAAPPNGLQKPSHAALV